MQLQKTNAAAAGRVALPAGLAALLDRRICDLPLTIAGTPLAPQVRGLYRDLERAGLQHFRPRVYLGDEWFSPEGVPAIAVPFYLADDRLKQLEGMLRREVEGGSPRWCRRLLRHEAGHAFEHAYEIAAESRFRGTWRRLFGDRRRPYRPGRYAVDATSPDFVVNLPDAYAQAHPDEDFAETFAVCLGGEAAWRRRYSAAPKALAKLDFMASLIRYYAAKAPKNAGGPCCYDARRLRRTLGRHYGKYLS
jgi:hypothetical protein